MLKKRTALILAFLLCAGLAATACAPRHDRGGHGYHSGPAYRPAPREEPRRFNGGSDRQRPSPKGEHPGPGARRPNGPR